MIFSSWFERNWLSELLSFLRGLRQRVSLIYTPENSLCKPIWKNVKPHHRDSNQGPSACRAGFLLGRIYSPSVVWRQHFARPTVQLGRTSSQIVRKKDQRHAWRVSKVSRIRHLSRRGPPASTHVRLCEDYKRYAHIDDNSRYLAAAA